MEALVYFSLCFIFPTILLKIWINEFVRNCRKIHAETTKNIEFMVAQNLYVWRKFNFAFGVYLFLHFSINQLLIILHVFLSLSNLLNDKLALDWNSLDQISFQFLNAAAGKEYIEMRPFRPFYSYFATSPNFVLSEDILLRHCKVF